MSLILLITTAALLWTTGWLISQLVIYRHVISTKDSMLATMTLGMLSGLLTGAVLGMLLINSVFTSIFYAMLVGVIVGSTSGFPGGKLIIGQGVISGIMGGIFGALAGTMLPHPHAYTIVRILFLLYLCLTLVLIYMIKHLYGKKEKSVLNHPKTLFTFLAFFLISYNQLGHVLPRINAEEPQTTRVSSQAKQTISITATEYQFTPNTIHVKQGEPVRLTIYNMGKQQHHFYIPGLKTRQLMIQAGSNQSIEFTPKKKGRFPFFCTVPGHKARGMSGTLIVK